MELAITQMSSFHWHQTMRSTQFTVTSLRCCVLGCRLKGTGAYNAIINQKQKSICQTGSLALSYKNSSPSKRMSSSGGKD
jgi:hypothetical protein